MVYQELYDTSNRILDDMSYKLANYIVSELGYRAVFFPRDCYYSIEVLVETQMQPFLTYWQDIMQGLGPSVTVIICFPKNSDQECGSYPFSPTRPLQKMPCWRKICVCTVNNA